MFPNSRQRSQANGAPNYLDLISRPSSLARMTDPGAIGPTFHTPTQADFREIYAARGTDGGSDGTRAFPADPANTDPVTGTAPARCTIASLQFNADGSVDIVRLEPTQDGWIDPGGSAPRDFKVVNW